MFDDEPYKNILSEFVLQNTDNYYLWICYDLVAAFTFKDKLCVHQRSLFRSTFRKSKYGFKISCSPNR